MPPTTTSSRQSGETAVSSTPGGRGGLVDRHPAGTLAGADGEDRHLAQPRHRVAGGGERRDPGGGEGRTHQRASRQRTGLGGRGAVVGGGVDVVRQHVADHRQLDGDVDQQRADGDPGHRVVDGAEGEGDPRIPLGGVGEAGREQEDRGRHQQGDGAALEDVEDESARTAQRRERLEELGQDRPQLDQQQGDRGDAGDHVQALGEPVAPARAGRERDRVARQLGVVADQAGDEADPEAHAEPQPDPSGDRGTPQPGREGVRRRWRQPGAHHATSLRTATKRSPNRWTWWVESPARRTVSSRSSIPRVAQRKGRLR